MRAVQVVVAVAGAACTASDAYYPPPVPGDHDAAVDTQGGGDDDGGARDGGADASPNAADLSIAITDSPPSVAASSTLTYAIEVTNHGGLDATDVKVTQRLPPGNVVFQSVAGIGWTCEPDGQLVTCTRAALLVGLGPSIVVKITTPGVGGTLPTTVNVEAGTLDPDYTNNEASASTTVLTPADLAIAITDSPDPVAAGAILNYAITVTNVGSGTAGGVSVLDRLPSGVAFVSASGTGWLCSEVDHDVTCLYLSLASGASSAITLVVTAPPSGGPVSNTATISAVTPDSDLANNQATTTTTVVNAPSDLAIALSASPSPVLAHSTLTYTIDVTNLGPRDATNVIVANRLPDGDVAFVSAGGIDWSCAAAGQIVTCTRPLLLVGAAPSIAIRITTPPAAGSSLVDRATVSASAADLDLSNNTISTTTDVIESADLSIVASAEPDPVLVNRLLTYTLSVNNDGPTAATAVTVVETLPPDATFVSAGGAGWTCATPGGRGAVVTCTRPSQNSASSSPSILIVATTPSTAGAITNSATVSSSTSDPDSANNTAATRSFVYARAVNADLSVAITDSPDPVQGTVAPGCDHDDCVLYTIRVANAGPDPAADSNPADPDPENVRVVIKLTSGSLPVGSFYSAVGTGWVCVRAVTQVECTRRSMAPGTPSAPLAAPPILLTWKAPSPGGYSLVVTSTVSATTADPIPDNDTVTQDTTILR